MGILSTSQIDSITLSQMLSILQSCTMQDLQANIVIVEKRFPGLGRRILLSMQGYGAELSPVGLARRSEWTSLLLQGRCFGQTVFCVLPAGGLFGQVQLRNPPGSTALVLVKAASVFCASGKFIIDNLTASLGSLLGQPQSLNATSVASVGGISRLSTAVAVPTSPIWENDISAGVMNQGFGGGLTEDFLAVLQPGQQLTITDVTAAEIVRASFLWAEVPLTYAFP